MKSTFEQELKTNHILHYTNVGDSMMPLIRQHKDMLIIVRPKEWDLLEGDGAVKLKRLDVPLYKRDSGQYVLHRVLKVRKGDYVICGDNRWQRETGITDRHIIGVLSAIVRDGKEIPVTDKRYRLYSHLWCDFFYIRALLLRIKKLPHRVRRKLKKN